MLRRIVIAVAALAVGLGTSVVLLAWGGGASRLYYAAAHDLPGGARVAAGDVVLVRATLDPTISAAALRRGDEAALFGQRLDHAVSAGGLLLRGDLRAAGAGDDRALVQVPLKDSPPLHGGERVDLFVIGGGDRLQVTPLATGLPVAGVSPGGVVLAVPARQASSFLYAGAAFHLAAVVVDGAGGGEPTVTTVDQALAGARG